MQFAFASAQLPGSAASDRAHAFRGTRAGAGRQYVIAQLRAQLGCGQRQVMPCRKRLHVSSNGQVELGLRRRFRLRILTHGEPLAVTDVADSDQAGHCRRYRQCVVAEFAEQPRARDATDEETADDQSAQ